MAGNERGYSNYKGEKEVTSEIVAYSDQHHFEVLFITGQPSGMYGFDQNFVVCRNGIEEVRFPCVAVEILVYMLDHLDELCDRGLKPACSPTTRNTALSMGKMWADFHLMEDIEGFTFYEEEKRLTFVASGVIRVLNSFWQRSKAQEE